MWEQLKRITKERSAICLFGSEPFSSHLRLSNLKMFKYDWVWVKSKSLGGNFVHAKNSPISTNENISVFSAGKISHVKKENKNRMIYNPQGLIDCLIKERRSRSSEGQFKHNINRPSHKEYIRNKTGYPDSFLRFNFKKFIDGNRVHPTQKPVALLEYLIKTYTLEGETVLDFTAGSFSTGVACVNTNRNFIGIEKDDHYFNIGKKRVEDTLNAKIQK